MNLCGHMGWLGLGLALSASPPLEVRYASFSASWARLSSVYLSLTACLSCRPNTACSSSKSYPSSDLALPYFDNYGAGRVGHGF